MEFEMKEVYVDFVRVVGRHRRDLGDITALARSIEQIRLIHPITITEDGTLIAGQRRLEAYRLLGRKAIPARIVSDLTSAVDRLQTERDENTERKPMTPEELVSLGRALEELERPKARERQSAGQFGSGHVTGTIAKGETTEIVADAIGMSPSSYKRARAVVDAANDPRASDVDRATAAAALAEMNETNNVSGAYAKVKQQRDAMLGQPRRATLDRAAAQRRALTSAVNNMSGMAHGLRQIEALHPDITSEEAGQWVAGLSEARQTIAAVIKTLKERTNVQA